MKDSNRYLFLSCFLFFSVFTIDPLLAQDDFIINNNGEKVIGEVIKIGFEKVKFRPSTDKKKMKFKPVDIKEAYEEGDGLFRSVFVPKLKKQIFLRVLEDGKIKLYEFYTNSGGGASMGITSAGFPHSGASVRNVQKYWYAEKSGEIIEVKTNSWWGSRKKRKEDFYNLIQDNEKIAGLYETEQKFSFDFVRFLIKKYNAN